jgi:uncharacterized protein (TIGR02594 family)
MAAPWLEVATRLLNTKELPGSANSPIILSWAQKLGGWVASFYKEDSVPWCGLFVAHCLSEAGIPGLPKNPLSALAWKDWGSPTDPREGALLVFQRPGGGHVGFYVGERSDAYRVRGGNQSDSVCDTWVAKDRLVGCRWPIGTPVFGNKIILTDKGELSKNEA